MVTWPFLGGQRTSPSQSFTLYININLPLPHLVSSRLYFSPFLISLFLFYSVAAKLMVGTLWFLLQGLVTENVGTLTALSAACVRNYWLISSTSTRMARSTVAATMRRD